jgi:H+-translocating NAD(P) transhydrogenase subunit beta
VSRELFIEAAYLVASLLFIFGLKALASPKTARRGMQMAQSGMIIAIAGTLLHHDVITFEWIIVGAVIGSVAGYVIAMWTPMTAMPQRTAFSHAFGGLAAALVGVSHFYSHGAELARGTMLALAFEVLLGSITFTGSLMAFGKLQGLLPGAPITYKGQNIVNALLFAALAGLGASVVVDPGQTELFYAMVALATVVGVSLVIPIGAADMPVVIALLNSYAGLAGCATGFALNNKILIVAGALDGASGFILSILMCKAMNRSITNVLFGAFGKAPEAGAAKEATGTVKSMPAEDAAMLLDGANEVVIVPGYGMAVSQAQHVVKKLTDVLDKRGVSVKFAIHPVAGRMPGHMNVLLAEAGVDYDKLYDMEQINGDFERCDVAIVIGANDVVNPAAKNDRGSPIFGMPILNVDKARSVLVLKRSMSPGFAGIENELFYQPNTMMVFGDATKTVENVVKTLADA